MSKQSPPRLKQRVHSTVTTFKYVPSLAPGVCDEVAFRSSLLRLVLDASVYLLHSLLNSNFWMLCHILHLQKGTDCQLGETEVLLTKIYKSSVIVQLYLFSTSIISISVGHRIIYFSYSRFRLTTVLNREANLKYSLDNNPLFSSVVGRVSSTSSRLTFLPIAVHLVLCSLLLCNRRLCIVL